jgi:hypothetical protein
VKSEAYREPFAPRLFEIVGKPHSLLILFAFILISGVAMLPAVVTMADHGATVLEWEFAGTVERSQEILAGWGDTGKTAAWWQLGLDLPFLIGYGLFLAGACIAVARRAQRIGRLRLERWATIVAWFGPLTAVSDLLQNISLALHLSGQETQPWPALAAIDGRITQILMGVGLIFVFAAFLATRSDPAAQPAEGLSEAE